MCRVEDIYIGKLMVNCGAREKGSDVEPVRDGYGQIDEILEDS